MRKIFEASTFVDDRGVMITVLKAQDNGECQYYGVAKVMLPVGSEEIRFPIPTNSLEDAFDQYDAELKKFSEEFQKQVAANKEAQAQSSSSATSELTGATS